MPEATMAPAELRATRQTLGLSQEQLSRLLLVPENTIQRWEAGTLGIRHGHVLRLALHGLAADLSGRAPLAAAVT